MRGLILGLVLIGVAIAALALAAPERFSQIGESGVASLVYMLLLLLLVGGGVFGIRRAPIGGRWPLYLLVWAGLIAAAVLLARWLGG